MNFINHDQNFVNPLKLRNLKQIIRHFFCKTFINWIKTSHQTRVIGDETPVNWYELRINGDETPVNWHEFRINGEETPVNWYELRINGHETRVIGHETRVIGHETRVIGHETQKPRIFKLSNIMINSFLKVVLKDFIKILKVKVKMI